MGLALGAPLPEGFFMTDQENYGHSDRAQNYSGGNSPVFIWATPFTYSDTRLEMVYAAVIVHQNGGPSPATNRVDNYSQAIGPILAHSFGNGFSASLNTFFRTPDNHFISAPAADIRVGLSYTDGGYNISATFGYTGTFGGHSGTPYGTVPINGISGSSDAANVDFTATKKFGKVELGLVGFAHTDLNTRRDNIGFNADGTTYSRRAGEVAVGGLVGYDFGRFTIQASVVRDVARRYAYNGLDANGNYGYGAFDTRGFFRVILPLYVAPSTVQTLPVAAPTNHGGR